MESKDLIAAMNSRYSAKVFDSEKKVSEDTLQALLECLRLSPSFFGIEAWKFVVVENPEIRKRLRTASYDQPKITDASHLVVLCARKDVTGEYVDAKTRHTANVQNVPVESLRWLRDTLNGAVSGRLADGTLPEWLEKQAYIALGVLIVSAAILGVDAWPMEGFDPLEYDEILGLDRFDLHAVVVCALGYRGDDPYAKLPKVRWPKEEVVMFVR